MNNLYSIYETSAVPNGAQPHLVATIYGLDVAQHILDQLETQHPTMCFRLDTYDPDQDHLVHWHDASMSLR